MCTIIIILYDMLYSEKFLMGSTFVDRQSLWFSLCRCAQLCHYAHVLACLFFAGLIFVVHESATKTAKIGPLKNFPLYDKYLNG